ncbi:MAG: ribosomal protein S18-alanine N-acetyltransferase [Chromatiaceae bacterium]|jgi:ribosomal-protein-alanine N-acetyltransferase
MSAVLEEPFAIIRKMAKSDLDEVIAVERRAYTHPWSEGILRDCLRVGYSCWVCERGDDIVGHAVMSIAVGEAHLLNLCIDPEQQRQGIGRRMLHRLLRVARDRQADTMFLEVRASNYPARQLYEAEGFAEIGDRRGYYPAHGGREDALLYAKPLL